MSAARLIVPYSTRGPAPRARLGHCCSACSSGQLGALRRPLTAAELGAADWQVSAAALNREARSALRRAHLSGLGLSQEASGTVEGASAGAKAGSIVPGIGTAIGAVVGAIAGYLLSAKHYFNVGQSNSQCAQLLQAWQHYLSIQGHVAGRALGWSTMQQLFHAAVGAGLFPGNDMHLQFHEGTLACAGHGDWVDDFLGVNLQGQAVNNCPAHNCMADALAKYTASRAAVPRGTADAVYFVDSILLPMNEHASIPWIYNGGQNPQVRELMYDLADAYLAARTSSTTPYVQYPAAQVASEATAGAVGLPGAAAPIAAGPASSSALVPYVSPAIAAGPGASLDQFTAAPGALYSGGGPVTAPITPGATPPPGSTAGITAGAGTILSGSTGLLLGVALLGVAAVAFMGEKKGHRAA